MNPTLCALLSALWLAAGCCLNVAAAGRPDQRDPDTVRSTAISAGGHRAEAQGFSILTARPTSRTAGTAFWIVAACCMLAAVLSLGFRSAGPWTVCILASTLLAAVLVLWTHPVWAPAAVGVLATTLAVMMAVRYRLTDHMKNPEPSEVFVFLSGLILTASAAYIRTGTPITWTRNLTYAALLGATLLLFLWKLKQPMTLWVLAVALCHLGMAAAHATLAPVGAARVLCVTGAIMTLAGIAAACVRRNTLAVVLSAELVVIGALVALAGAAGNASGLMNTQVGWTVAVGLPLVQVGLGLALVQKLGPEEDTDSNRPAEKNESRPEIEPEETGGPR